MKVLVTRTSDWNFKEIREYKDLDECCKTLLLSKEYFSNPHAGELVVAFSDKEGCEYEVEIYDGYRE